MTARGLLVGLLLLAACTGPQPLEPIASHDVKAWQWGYAPNVMTVHQGQLVRLKLVSLDVGHGLKNDELGVNVAIPPKGADPVVVEFRPGRVGDFVFSCPADCGPGQSRQLMRVIVMP